MHQLTQPVVKVVREAQEAQRKLHAAKVALNTAEANLQEAQQAYFEALQDYAPLGHEALVVVFKDADLKM